MTFGTRTLAPALLLCAIAAPATAQNNDGPSAQGDLAVTLNDGFDDGDALKFDWPMLSIGTGQYEDGPTGVTVIRFGRKVHGAVDARGGGPARSMRPISILAMFNRNSTRSCSPGGPGTASKRSLRSTPQ
jgi:hypothetical protein